MYIPDYKEIYKNPDCIQKAGCNKFNTVYAYEIFKRVHIIDAFNVLRYVVDLNSKVNDENKRVYKIHVHHVESEKKGIVLIKCIPEAKGEYLDNYFDAMK
jgi:hypothetical protein